MWLRDLAVHADDAIVERYKGGFVQRFHREACSVVEHYLSLIHRKVQTCEIAKVNFTFTDVTDEQPEHSNGRCSYTWPFDFGLYTSSDTDRDKQAILADAFHAALTWVAEHEGWDCVPLNEAQATILDRNFQFSGTSKKSWLSADGKFRARIAFNWRLADIELLAVLYRNRSTREIQRVHLTQAVPMAGILHEYLNAGRWQSNTRFQIAIKLPFRKKWSADFGDAIASCGNRTKP